MLHKLELDVLSGGGVITDIFRFFFRVNAFLEIESLIWSVLCGSTVNIESQLFQLNSNAHLFYFFTLVWPLKKRAL